VPAFDAKPPQQREMLDAMDGEHRALLARQQSRQYGKPARRQRTGESRRHCCLRSVTGPWPKKASAKASQSRQK
jgi:hypothetical protein